MKKAFAYPYNLLLAALLTVLAVFGLINENNKTAVVFHAITDEKIVAITVDDGPDPLYTPQILDILSKHKVLATFFVVGRQVEKHPGIIRREVAEGHEVANHSYTHNNLHTMSKQEAEWELVRTNGIISQFTGKNVKWFRPPCGAYNREVTITAKECGLTNVLWTRALETHNDKNPEQMAWRLIRGIKPGGIILMHDSRLDRTKSVRALPLIIEGLQRKGYRFVTVSELLGEEKEVQV